MSALRSNATRSHWYSSALQVTLTSTGPGARDQASPPTSSDATPCARTHSVQPSGCPAERDPWLANWGRSGLGRTVARLSHRLDALAPSLGPAHDQVWPHSWSSCRVSASARMSSSATTSGSAVAVIVSEPA